MNSETKIYIICPANNSTGGPEALHQLCEKLTEILHFDAGIFYIDKKKNINPKPEVYHVYDTKEIQRIEDKKENILIIPESLTHYIAQYPKTQKIVWWLSVDFYSICMKNRHRGLKFYWSKFILGKKEVKEYLLEDLPDVFHWAQSYRSYLYLLDHGISENKIQRVCDYMNPVFMDRAKDSSKQKKENIIIYNPKKGKKEIQSIQEKCRDYKWIPIQGMTPLQVSNLMERAKLYIDFGYNPGRDRMLRESALMKCAIISGENGSSFYKEDLNIPEEYKFEYSEEKIPEIVSKVHEVLADYEKHILNYELYLHETLEEEKKFEEKLTEILK